MEAKVFTSGNLGNDAKSSISKMENQSSPSQSLPTAITPMLMANKFKKLPGMTAKSSCQQCQ
jgi:hypothetical protein